MSDNLQIPPDMQLTVTVTLTAQHWHALQRVLDQAPHGIVRPLLDAIQQQCMAQAVRQRATQFPDGSLAAQNPAMLGRLSAAAASPDAAIGASDNGEGTDP